MVAVDGITLYSSVIARSNYRPDSSQVASIHAKPHQDAIIPNVKALAEALPDLFNTKLLHSVIEDWLKSHAVKDCLDFKKSPGGTCMILWVG